MKLITFIVNHYVSIPYERFTDKAIEALSLLRMIKDTKEEDIERVEYLIENTNEKVRVSIYKLDRNINPTKGEFSIVARKAEFKRNSMVDGKINITLTEDSMQYYLCCAISEINDIVFNNLQRYEEELPIDMSDDINDDNTNLFGDV